MWRAGPDARRPARLAGRFELAATPRVAYGTGLRLRRSWFALVAGRYFPGPMVLGRGRICCRRRAAWPRPRAYIGGRLRCARTRRRLLACMRETRVATSTGRLPLTLRARATPAGERLTFGLFPGQSAEQLDARTEELRAAARARYVSVTRDPGRADRVTVDVIRRDLLHAGLVLPSPLVGVAAALLPHRLVPDRPADTSAAPAEGVSS